MESSSPSVPFPLLQAPVESTYRACTIPYRFPSDNPRKATPVEIQWIDLFFNSVPSFKQRAENDPMVPDAPAKAEKFAQRTLVVELSYWSLAARAIAMASSSKVSDSSHRGPKMNEFVKLGGEQLAPYYVDILGAILPCISDKEEKIRVVARETNEELRAIKADPIEGFDIGAILSIAKRFK